MSGLLPPKEAAHFKRIVKAYETKQYKSGLKAAKAILATHPNHGETLCMKGLILNSMSPDKKDEAFALAKQGLQSDMQSHVCWHVYGLLHRYHQDYDQAIKSYRNALRRDKENIQILKDLSVLQTHMRDLQGFKISRATIWKLRPNQAASWIGYAMAHHLCGEYEQAIEVLSSYEKTLETLSGNKVMYNYERSELILFKGQIMEEAGNPERSLDYLLESEQRVCDRRAFKETVARLMLLLGKKDGAEKVYRMLVSENQEDLSYFEGLERALGIDDSTPEAERLKVFEALRETYPKSQAIKRLPLRFTTGDSFRGLLDAYLRPNIRKGCTPLFRVLRPLYADDGKRAIIAETLLGYLASLDKCNKLDESDDTETESPSMRVWLNFFIAQHFDLLGSSTKALEHINAAIDHTPTVIELYMVKAKIYKHGGDVASAAEWLNYARELDTADRFINSKCVKYQLRSGDIAKAEENVALFTREGGSDPISQLADMQCIWFETEEARAQMAKGDIGTALKKLHSIESHFSQYHEDQFDFHSYCMRKMTLRAYLRLFRMEDKLWGHKFFARAAQMAIACYTGLHDTPLHEQKAAAQDPGFEGMTEAEKKKAISKIRKQQKKEAARRAKASQEAASKKAAAQNGVAAAAKQDVNLAETKAPLEDVMKFLRPLQRMADDQSETQVAAFEVYSRKRRFLLMLQAVKRGLKIDAQHPEFHKCVVAFLKMLQEATDLHAVVKEVIDTELKALGQATDPEKHNEAFYAANKDSPVHVLAYAEAQVRLKPDSSKDLVALVTNAEGPGITHTHCAKVLRSLTKTFKAPKDVIAAFKTACHATHPLATCFVSA